MKKVLFVCPYPSQQAPSQRFRFEQYLDFLSENNVSISFSPFLDDHTWAILYKKGYFFQKIFGILKGFFRRIGLLFTVWRFDFVFVHREATPLGYPFFEWSVAKIFRKKIIFDFDDAIWLPNTSQTNKLAAFLKYHQKTKAICRWAYKVSVGNAYLADFALQFNKNVIQNPTTIDTEHLHKPVPKNTNGSKNALKTIIGWTGTHSTLVYLNEIVPIIEKLSKEYAFEFLVISNQNPHFQLNNFRFESWNKTTEIQDLAQIDIGIMPLSDDKWAKGKCGFKALQYMALEIATLASPVGVNTEIIDNDQNGILCANAQDWENALKKLLENNELRQKLGKNARRTVLQKYSVLSNQENFLGLFV